MNVLFSFWQAALFVADKLGVESIVLQVKGAPGPRSSEAAAEGAHGLFV